MRVYRNGVYCRRGSWGEHHVFLMIESAMTGLPVEDGREFLDMDDLATWLHHEPLVDESIYYGNDFPYHAILYPFTERMRCGDQERDGFLDARDTHADCTYGMAPRYYRETMSSLSNALQKGKLFKERV